MKRPAAASLLVALAACGGNVILDASSGSGGHGGSAGIGGAGSGGAIGVGGAIGIGGTGGSTMFTAVSSSAGGATGGGPGSPCSVLHLYADPTCEGCAEKSCCEQLAACGSGDCFRLAGCLADCPQGSPTCQNDCLSTFTAGSADFKALATCFNDACGTLPECGSPSSNVCDSALPPTASTACASCLTVACCPAAEQCGQSGSCQKCFLAMAPMGCDPTYDALLTCEHAVCSNVCP